jgi:hypothetical protein
MYTRTGRFLYATFVAAVETLAEILPQMSITRGLAHLVSPLQRWIFQQ